MTDVINRVKAEFVRLTSQKIAHSIRYVIDDEPCFLTTTPEVVAMSYIMTKLLNDYTLELTAQNIPERLLCAIRCIYYDTHKGGTLPPAELEREVSNAGL